MSKSRQFWFGWIFLLLLCNGAMRHVLSAVSDSGWLLAAINLFGISAMLWAAALAALHLLFRIEPEERTPLRRFDIPILACGILVALLPVASASSGFATIMALYFFATNPRGSASRRAAVICAAITTSLLWGRVILAFGSEYLLAFDGILVGLIAGTGGEGNLVNFSATGEEFMVAPGCSSLHGISLALVFWVSVTQYFNLTLDRRAWVTLLTAAGAAIAVNLLRLSAIALSPENFDMLHTGSGATGFGWLALIAIVLTVWLGLKNALLRNH